MKYILVYQINDYPEMGGGIGFENLGSPEALTSKVNELNMSHPGKFSVLFSGVVMKEITFKPVETVTKLEIE